MERQVEGLRHLDCLDLFIAPIKVFQTQADRHRCLWSLCCRFSFPWTWCCFDMRLLSAQSVVLFGLGVILWDPIPWGPITTYDGNHVYWNESMMFDATNSNMLEWYEQEGVWLLYRIRSSTVQWLLMQCDWSGNARFLLSPRLTIFFGMAEINPFFLLPFITHLL